MRLMVWFGVSVKDVMLSLLMFFVENFDLLRVVVNVWVSRLLVEFDGVCCLYGIFILVVSRILLYFLSVIFDFFECDD